MSYDQNMERAPHPEKAEHIFLSIITKSAVEKGDLRLLEGSWEADLQKLLQGASKVWRDYAASGRRAQIAAIRAGMEFASSLDDLNGYARQASEIPHTKAEREATLAVYEKCKRDITNPTP